MNNAQNSYLTPGLLGNTFIHRVEPAVSQSDNTMPSKGAILSQMHRDHHEHLAKQPEQKPVKVVKKKKVT